MQRRNGVTEKCCFGASEGIRTLDIHLGKVTLYQAELRSLPNREPEYAIPARMQALFGPILRLQPQYFAA